MNNAHTSDPLEQFNSWYEEAGTDVVALATASVTVWLAVRRSEWAWVAVSVLMVVGPPRVVTSYVAFIVVGYLLAARQRFPGSKFDADASAD